MKTQSFSVTGMSCSACSAHVTKTVSKLAGVKTVNVNLLANRMQVEYDESVLSAAQICQAVDDEGYGASVVGEQNVQSPETAQDDYAKEAKAVRLRLYVSFAFLIPLMVVAMGPMIGMPTPAFLQNPMVMALVQFLLCLPVVIANQKYYRVGFKALFRRSPNMDSLIAVGSGAALLHGIWTLFNIAIAMGDGQMQMASHHAEHMYFESAATILALITLGKYFEARSKGKTGDAIRKLMDLAPKVALVERNGVQGELPIEQVVIGDTVLIKPGASVPLDGTILSGNSALDESALTGESLPVDKQQGDRVSQGTINLSGFLTVRVDKLAGETALSEIVRLVEQAGASKAPIGRLADKISGVFVPVVIGIALLAAVIWLIAGQDISFAISIAISVLVISCPCALGLATPVAIMVGTGRAASLGILFKSAESLETLHSVKAMVLDKTGTITEGKPGVTDILPADGYTEQTLLSFAAALEKPSEHPLAQAVVRHAGDVQLDKVEQFMAVPGQGVQANIDGRRALAGNRRMMGEQGVDISLFEQRAMELERQGKSCLFFAQDGKVAGVLALADQIKPSSSRAVKELIQMGVTPVMLTGDNEQAARAVAQQVGIEQVRAQVLPQDKEAEVRALQERGMHVAMVGDGINDAPALTRADVGLAIGAGTDIAIESADVVLMKGDLMDAVDAVRISRAVIRNIRQNLFWAFFYNVIGIPLAAGVFYTALGWLLNPMIGAAAMSLSSVCVVSNALRLRRFKGHAA